MKIKSLEDLEKKISLACEDFLKEYSEEIGRRLYRGYASIVDKYYDAYTPIKYKRKYTLYYMSSLYYPSSGVRAKTVRSNFNKFYSDNFRYNFTGNKLEADITMDIDSKYSPIIHKRKNPANIPGNDWILDRVYNDQIHGFTDAENELWGTNGYITQRPQWYGHPSRWSPVDHVPVSSGDPNFHSSLLTLKRNVSMQIRRGDYAQRIFDNVVKKHIFS